MKKIMEDIKAFKEAHGHTVPDKLTTPNYDRIDLLSELVGEEYIEVMDAIYDDEGNINVNRVQLAKELADLVYVTVGLGIEFGIPMDKVWDEVQRSNMSKIGPDGKFAVREDGKILKGPNYSPADIEKVLK